MTGDVQYTNIPLITTFLKYFSRTYLGPRPDTAEQLPAGVEELVPETIQAKMRELFLGYFNAASKTLIKGQHVSHLASTMTDSRNSWSKTDGTTKRTSNLEKSLKIANKPTKR